MPVTKDRLVIFDGNAILHRAWHALPPLTSPSGQLVNAVYGFTSMFLKVLKELKPTHVVVAFDRAEPTFRHKSFALYKAQRVKQAQEFYDQFPLVKQIIQAFQVPVVEFPGYEADDIIGTIASQISPADQVEVIIVTGDMDTMQLVSDQVRVYTPRKGLSDPIIYNPAAVVERYGLLPEQMVDYKALRGDPSDNIPGVKGIGEKTAVELIKSFGSLDDLYQALAKGQAKQVTPRIKELLLQGESMARLSRQLSVIARDVPLKFKWTDSRLRSFVNEDLVSLFQNLGFKSLLSRLPELQTVLKLAPLSVSGVALGKSLTHYETISDPIELQRLVTKLKKQKFFVLDTETDSLNPWRAKLVAVSLAWAAGQAYVILNNPKLLDSPAGRALGAILADPKVLKGGHNLKYDVEVLGTAGCPVAGLSFDTMLAAYLLQKGERALDLKSLVFQEFGYQMQRIEELIGNKGQEQKTMAQVAPEEVSRYAAADADFTLRLKEKLEAELTREKLLELFKTVEVPLVRVLIDMEQAGVKIDGVYLKTLAVELRRRLKKREQAIYRLVGSKFNINSPKQLADILFVKLGLSSQGLKKTKTGISTSAGELNKLVGQHPVVDEIFEYRELNKLLSTYVEALPALINNRTGRIHTSFNQTVTTTGRLSSSDPNLQNIPIRGEWAATIRRAFVAEPGYVLLSADYSQIDLRVAAHLSQDKKLLEVFKKGLDVHASTAAFIHGVKLNEVTPEQRRSAKEVNFGVLYGMGAWGLSERTGLARFESQQFIDRYFKTFSGLAKWIELVKQTARQQGFVATLLGRRRYLPEINSSIAQVRAQAERMAVNLPVQGTAADLMKLAMIKVAGGLPAVSPASRLILQVHDELVLEVPAAEVKVVGQLVKREMENALKLKVPVVAEVKTGINWAEMEKLEIE